MSLYFHGSRNGIKIEPGLCLTDCRKAAEDYAGPMGSVRALDLDLTGLCIRSMGGYNRITNEALGDRVEDRNRLVDEGIDAIFYNDESPTNRPHETLRLLSAAALNRCSAPVRVWAETRDREMERAIQMEPSRQGRELAQMREDHARRLRLDDAKYRRDEAVRAGMVALESAVAGWVHLGEVMTDDRSEAGTFMQYLDGESLGVFMGLIRAGNIQEALNLSTRKAFALGYSDGKRGGLSRLKSTATGDLAIKRQPPHGTPHERVLLSEVIKAAAEAKISGAELKRILVPGGLIHPPWLKTPADLIKRGGSTVSKILKEAGYPHLRRQNPRVEKPRPG